MCKSISVAVKNYIRTVIYIALTVLLFVLTNMELKDSYNTITNFEICILSSMKIGLVGYAVVALLAYEYMRKVKACGMLESLQVVPKAQENLFVAQFLLLLIVLVAWCINVFGWQLAAYRKYEINYAPMMKNTVLSDVLYLFLPGVVAILLGTLLALKSNRGFAYAVIVLTTFLCSPVLPKLFYYQKLLGVQIIDVVDWYSIMVPNTNWYPDVSYGTAIEIHHWALDFFWIFLFSAGILFGTGRKSKAKSVGALCLVALSLVCGVRFYGRHYDSYMLKDNRPDGMLDSEFTYRDTEPELEEQWANFAVAKYNIDLTIKSNTKGDVYLELEENDLTEYIFTMHHGFEIKSIKDGEGNKLEYTQVSDFITVKSDKPLTQLHFTHQGHAGKYYSNSQGIALPGYLPYYPVPGHFKIWDEQQNGYLSNTDRETSYFELTVHSDLNVACNLKETGENTFAGEAEAISLYAGLIEKYTEGGVTYWCSPLDKKTPNLDDFEEVWNDLATKIGLDEPLDLDQMVFFVQPFTITSSNGNNDNYAEFSDHIILADFKNIDARRLCREKIISITPYSNDTWEVYCCFNDYLCGGNQPPAFNVTWEEIEILAKERWSSENAEKYWDAREKFEWLFSYKIKTLGDQYVLTSVYNFLQNPTGNEIEFLYNLGVENND